MTSPVPTLYGASRGSVHVGDTLDLTGDWGDVALDQITAVFDGSVLSQGRSTQSGQLKVVVPGLSDIGSRRRVQVNVRVYGHISNPATVEVSEPTGGLEHAPARAASLAAPNGSYHLTR